MKDRKPEPGEFDPFSAACAYLLTAATAVVDAHNLPQFEEGVEHASIPVPLLRQLERAVRDVIDIAKQDMAS